MLHISIAITLLVLVLFIIQLVKQRRWIRQRQLDQTTIEQQSKRITSLEKDKAHLKVRLSNYVKLSSDNEKTIDIYVSGANKDKDFIESLSNEISTIRKVNRHLEFQIDELTEQRHEDSINGQNALDEANNKIQQLNTDAKDRRRAHRYRFERNLTLEKLNKEKDIFIEQQWKEIKDLTNQLSRKRWENKKKWHQLKEQKEINNKALQQLGYQTVVLRNIQSLQELSTRPSKLRTYLMRLPKL